MDRRDVDAATASWAGEPASGPAAPGAPAGGDDARYRILGELGRGGMATVDTALDTQLDRKVALKILHGDHGVAHSGRLLREAQALARLRHPCVVTVFDVGTRAGRVFVAMELVPGTSLRTWLHAQPRTPAEITRVCLDAARGLAAAHAVGLIHRDFKPDNVVIDDAGAARVIDFGLARLAELDDPSGPDAPAADAPPPSGDVALDRTITRDGAIVGTLPYIAPEVFRGEPGTAASDHPLQSLPTQPVGVPFPTREWPIGSLQDDVDRESLEAASEDAFARRVPDLGATYALVVVQRGRIVYERYGGGVTRKTRLPSWSMAKSVSHALVGIAVRRLGVNIDAAMGHPAWRADDPRARISWRTWMQMADGLRNSEFQSPTFATMDAAHMLYGRGRQDNAAFCAQEPLIHAPRTHWNYNSYAWVLTDDALTRLAAPQSQTATERRRNYAAWMESELFSPIGLRSALAEFDGAGRPTGSAWLFATARDYARLGLPYLRDGVWEGRRILPEGWVDFGRTAGPASNSNAYGAGGWITPPDGRGRGRPEPLQNR